MTDLLKFSIPGKPEYVGVVRLAASSVANRAGFDVEAIEDIKVAVAEACNNAILHGISDNCCNYEIAFTLDEKKLTIAIDDNGKGYDIGNYQEPDLANPKEGGLGFFIIRALMDEVQINSNTGKGTTITMTKYI
jgi:serine/threonine-protein kinase RsbW